MLCERQGLLKPGFSCLSPFSLPLRFVGVFRRLKGVLNRRVCHFFPDRSCGIWDGLPQEAGHDEDFPQWISQVRPPKKSIQLESLGVAQIYFKRDQPRWAFAYLTLSRPENRVFFCFSLVWGVEELNSSFYLLLCCALVVRVQSRYRSYKGRLKGMALRLYGRLNRGLYFFLTFVKSRDISRTKKR